MWTPHVSPILALLPVNKLFWCSVAITFMSNNLSVADQSSWEKLTPKSWLYCKLPGNTPKSFSDKIKETSSFCHRGPQPLDSDCCPRKRTRDQRIPDVQQRVLRGAIQHQGWRAASVLWRRSDSSSAFQYHLPAPGHCTGVVPRPESTSFPPRALQQSPLGVCCYCHLSGVCHQTHSRSKGTMLRIWS